MHNLTLVVASNLSAILATGERLARSDHRCVVAKGRCGVGHLLVVANPSIVRMSLNMLKPIKFRYASVMARTLFLPMTLDRLAVGIVVIKVVFVARKSAKWRT